MNDITYTLIRALSLHTAEAAGITKLTERVIVVLVNPIIILAFSIAIAYFLWGLIRFLWNRKGGSDTADDKRHMLWGIVGMFIMISAFGIVNFAIRVRGGTPLDIREATLEESAGAQLPTPDIQEIP